MATWSHDSSRVPREQGLRDSLARSIDSTTREVSMVLDLLDALTIDGAWRELTDRKGNPFPTFTRFLATPRPHGLGLQYGDLQKYLALEHKSECGPYRKQADADRIAAMRERVRELLA